MTVRLGLTGARHDAQLRFHLDHLMGVRQAPIRHHTQWLMRVAQAKAALNRNKVTTSMADKQKKAEEKAVADQDLRAAIANANAPFIYTDGVPCYGHVNGIIQVTLDAVRLQPGLPKPLADRVVVGHLRMNVPAARGLLAALQSAILLAERPTGVPN